MEGYSGAAHQPGATNEEQDPLGSLHTQSFTEILSRAGISLAVSTYQAGKVVLIRADEGITNTHFRTLQKPMGMASGPGRLTVGTAFNILDLRNTPAAAPSVEPRGRHDALYLPRATYCTGDVDIHEMAWEGDALFFVNTRFSCLCKLNPNYSFDPVWRPSFISAYDPRDRCHLNGLGSRDGKIRYVSALAKTNSPGGWREHKSDGGFVFDLTSNKIIVDGIAMPHSPRWHDGAIWYLESGSGLLRKKVPGASAAEAVCKLPGFTRGLDFFGKLAFIGVSQVRETAVFSGLDITKNEAVRECGVWVVNIDTGDIVGYLQFTAGVQEIFSVCVLPHKFPEILLNDQNQMRRNYVIRDELLKDCELPDEDWQSAEHLFEQANNFANTGQFAKAEQSFLQSLELDKGFLPARFNLGLIYCKQENWLEAKGALESVLEAEAGHVECMNQLGFVAYKLGDLAEAKLYFERALQLKPQMAQAKLNLDVVLKELEG